MKAKIEKILLTAEKANDPWFKSYWPMGNISQSWSGALTHITINNLLIAAMCLCWVAAILVYEVRF